jgi:hypothetical protein
VRRLLIGGSPVQGRYPASEVNDGTCPEKPVHLTGDGLSPPLWSLSRSDLCWLDLSDQIKSCILSASWNPFERPTFGAAEERS